MDNDNVPRKNSQKNADTKIEAPPPYITELVEIMPKYWISGKIYRPISIGGLNYFYVSIYAISIKIKLP